LSIVPFDAYAAPQLIQTARQASRRVAGGAAMAGTALLVMATIVGLLTASDYGLTTDEFNTDDYGPKALAWYTSLGADQSQFETVEAFLWYYGPWHQILTAFLQSLHVADPITVRHAVTFLTGIAGLAALIPIARLSVGAWAGPTAIVLCLMTGYLYGGLFFSPVDVPFLAAMTWAVWAILEMARRAVPTWPTTIVAGIFTGLAMSTRTGGIITHVYLAGAISLCALEILIRKRGEAARPLALIAGRTLAAMAIAWVVMIALWPWLQIGNPLQQFVTAYAHFTHNPMAYAFPHWGEAVSTDDLPLSYIPGQLLARLPELFLLLLVLALAFAILAAVRFGRVTLARSNRIGADWIAAPALVLTRARRTLLVTAAATVPIAFVIVTHATHYDGIRHMLFTIPMLALLAGGALLRLVPALRRWPMAAAAVLIAVIAHVATTGLTLWRLHPLEYVAMNSLTGGTRGAAGRFELDYWGAAAGEALRMLERRLDADRSGRFATSPPRVMVCLRDRDGMAGTLFRRNWVVEKDPAKADFLIETERWPCARGTDAAMIGGVVRAGVPFAQIYTNNRSSGTASVPSHEAEPKSNERSERGHGDRAPRPH
jgi:hypothetical protein